MEVDESSFAPPLQPAPVTMRLKEEADTSGHLDGPQLQLLSPSTSGTCNAPAPNRSRDARSSTPSSESGEMRTLQESKWLVNQSRLMQLFKNCNECGGKLVEPRVASTGNQVRIKWECVNGHGGLWTSCPDVHGIPENIGPRSPSISSEDSS